MEERTSCLRSLEEVEGAGVVHLEAMGAELQEEGEPWMDYPWGVEAGHQRLLAAGVAAMAAGYLCQGWMWW